MKSTRIHHAVLRSIALWDGLPRLPAPAPSQEGMRCMTVFHAWQAMPPHSATGSLVRHSIVRLTTKWRRTRPLHRSAHSSSGRPPLPSSSVNDDEVRKFGSYGESWWDSSSTQGAGPLHSMNPVRVGYIVEKAGTLRGLRVLDVGCGGGLLSESLARVGALVTGIDPSPENIEVARRHAAVDPQTRGIRYERATAEELEAAGETFDVVVASEVIEHVKEPSAFVRSLSRLSARDVFISTINRTLKSYLVAIVGAERLTRIVPPGTHEWSSFLQPQEVVRMIRSATPGMMEVKDVSGLVYNPLTNKWSLDPARTDVNYILHARRRIAS